MPPAPADLAHLQPDDWPARWRDERIAPPATRPTLPPLLPSQTVGLPTPPVAATIARQGAWVEASAEDDLDVLAAQIKRILDEEARRHGIDV